MRLPFFHTSGRRGGGLARLLLLIGMGLTAGLKQCADHTWQEYKDGTLCYLLGCLAATAFNIVFHKFGAINLFYISPYYPMRQRVFRQIGSVLGNGWGILIYLAAIPAGAFVFHLFWRILHLKILLRLKG